VPIVGQACGKGGTVVEGEWFQVFRPVQLLMEGIDAIPILEDSLFLTWKDNLFRRYVTLTFTWIEVGSRGHVKAFK
jgi:hypothetical protein